MSASTNSIINDFNRNVSIFINVWCISTFILGAIGHTFNIYLFTHRRFRSNSCIYYFLASTLASCGIIYITIPLRYLQAVYSIDVFIYSLLLCQILSYLLNCIRVLPAWFIALASLDRFFCSSSTNSLRQWSNIRITSYVISSTTVFIFLIFLHMPFYYTILQPERTCNSTTSIYRGFLAMWSLVFFSWIPSLSMLIFGLLTIRNIHQSKMKVSPQNNRQRNQKKLDMQMIRMVIAQSFVFGSTSTAFSICQLYISIMSNMKKLNDVEKAKFTALNTISNWISLTGPCLSFYLCTFTSKLFRNELIKLFNQRQ